MGAWATMDVDFLAGVSLADGERTTESLLDCGELRFDGAADFPSTCVAVVLATVDFAPFLFIKEGALCTNEDPFLSETGDFGARVAKEADLLLDGGESALDLRC